MTRIGDILGSFSQADGRSEHPNGRRGSPSEMRGEASPALGPGEVCPICQGRGFLTYDVPPGHPDFGKVVACRCTQARVAVERAQALRAVSNLGQLSRMTFDSFLPDGVGLSQPLRYNLRHAYDLSVDFAREPKGWLVLLGGYGCGKTHLAAAIANQRIELGCPVIFVAVPDLLDHLRATYAPTSTVTFDQRLEEIREAPLLILDDLGAQNTTPWAQEKLFQILNHRYNGRLPTVITSNQQLDDLEPRLGSRLGDPDLSQVYVLLAPDFRGHTPERTTTGLSTLALHADQLFENFSLRPELPDKERESLRLAFNRARSFAEEPAGWLVLTGTYGCGKTHLAAAIANYRAYRATTGDGLPMFVVVPDLLDHLRATFSPNSSTSLDKVFEQVRSAPLLVLDDLGTESATPWAREKLFQLLNHRYAARLATVITTADSIDKIEPWLRSRMLDATRSTVFAILAPSLYDSDAQVNNKNPPHSRGRSAK